MAFSPYWPAGPHVQASERVHTRGRDEVGEFIAFIFCGAWGCGGCSGDSDTSDYDHELI